MMADPLFVRDDRLDSHQAFLFVIADDRHEHRQCRHEPA